QPRSVQQLGLRVDPEPLEGLRERRGVVLHLGRRQQLAAQHPGDGAGPLVHPARQLRRHLANPRDLGGRVGALLRHLSGGWVAAPAFVAVSSGVGVDSSTSTITLAAPSGLQTGDHQLTFVGGVNTRTTVSPPNGWSLVGAQPNTTSGPPFRLFCFRSTTATGSQSFSKGTSAPAVAAPVAYRGGPGFA